MGSAWRLAFRLLGRPSRSEMGMEDDFMKRGYLLPEGCKDLIDVLKLKSKGPAPPKPRAPQQLPPIIGEITVPAWMTVTELAAALAQKPFQIIGDLMEVGIFANVKQQLDFETISRVLRKHGFVAKRGA